MFTVQFLPSIHSSQMRSFQRTGLLPRPVLSSHPTRPAGGGDTQEHYPLIQGVCHDFQTGRCSFKATHQDKDQENVHCCVICLKVGGVINSFILRITFFQLRCVIISHISQGFRYGGCFCPLKKKWETFYHLTR